MTKPVISIIAAIGKNRELGKNNKLLWHIPEDLHRFKTLTLGHPVIMGRKTYESISRPLPHRTNIIITRDPNYSLKDCLIAHSLAEAIAIAKSKDKDEIFIIGGGQIYQQAINIADKLYLTVIDAEDKDADTFFPDYSRFNRIIKSEMRNDGNLRFTFLELTRIDK